MNCKTLKELCGEAGIDCGPWNTIGGKKQEDRRCFSVTTGDVFNTVLDLIQTVLNNQENGGSGNETLEVVEDLCRVLRSPKQYADGMDIVLYWPAIEWID